MLGNAIGAGAAVVFVLAGIAALIALVTRLNPRMREFHEAGMGVWSNADLRGRFLLLVGFCALGVLATIVGFVFGDWPRG